MFTTSKALIRVLAADEAKAYLRLLARTENCLIIAAVRDQVQIGFDEEMGRLWCTLGFTMNLVGQAWRAYVGVVDSGKAVFEKLSVKDENVIWQGNAGGTELRVKSGSFWAENTAEIYVDEKNYSLNRTGINIVVYDKADRRVIDSVNLFTHQNPAPICHADLELPEYMARKVIREKVKSIVKSVVKDNKQITKKEIENLLQKNAPPTLAVPNDPPLEVRFQEYTERLKMSAIFPKEYNEKIKVRLVFDFGPFFWNCVESLLRAFLDDPRFQVIVVVVKDYGTPELSFEKTARLAEKLGVEYVRWSDYNIRRDRPDILILSRCGFIETKERQMYYDCGRYSRFSVVLPYSISVDSLELFFHSDLLSMSKRLHNLSFDYCLWDTMIYNYLKERGGAEYCAELGNPKFDAIYAKLGREHDTPPEWEKFKGKKVVLWAYDHEWEVDNFTLDQYAKMVFDYFKSNPDICLIFRPHPGEGGRNYWSTEDIDWLKNYMTQSPNMIWDDALDYSVALDVADAIMTDVSCGVTTSAFSTMKPIGIFLRMGIPVPAYNNPLVESSYQITDGKGTIGFLEMVKRGDDPKLEDRKLAFHKGILHFDGKNGQRMKDFIVEKYFEKCGMPEGMEQSPAPAVQE